MIRGFIGVIHLPAMPGDPKADRETRFDEVLDFAVADGRALLEGGVFHLLSHLQHISI